jgi:hypothetical protein
MGDVGASTYSSILADRNNDVFVLANNGVISKLIYGGSWIYNGRMGSDRFGGITYDYSGVNGYLYLISTTGDVWQSVNNGTAWTYMGDVASGNNYEALSAMPNNNLYALRNDGRVYSSADHGSTWAYMSDVGALAYADMSTTMAGTIYVMASTGEIYSSANGAASWTLRGDVGGGTNYVSISPDMTNNLYALRLDGRVYRSTDGGATWTQMGDVGGENYVAIAVDRTNTNYLYVITDSGRVYESTNNGAAWTYRGSSGSVTFTDIECFFLPELDEIMIMLLPVFAPLVLVIICVAFRPKQKRKEESNGKMDKVIREMVEEALGDCWSGICLDADTADEARAKNDAKGVARNFEYRYNKLTHSGRQW